MKTQSVFAGFFLLYTTLAFSADYPQTPDPVLTPGKLCEIADEMRPAKDEDYKYCERSVDREVKENVVALYDRNLQYSIQTIGRIHFKIDHYIPLCMGGSNDMENLWPQHLTIGVKTDRLEYVACMAMNAKQLTQARAIEIIKEAKNNPERAESLLSEVEALAPGAKFE